MCVIKASGCVEDAKLNVFGCLRFFLFFFCYPVHHGAFWCWSEESQLSYPTGNMGGTGIGFYCEGNQCAACMRSDINTVN